MNEPDGGGHYFISEILSYEWRTESDVHHRHINIVYLNIRTQPQLLYTFKDEHM